jgi:hypothetical protein
MEKNVIYAEIIIILQKTENVLQLIFAQNQELLGVKNAYKDFIFRRKGVLAPLKKIVKVEKKILGYA